MFYGDEIIFDNIPSTLYGLRIGYFDMSTDSVAGSESQIYEKYIYRKSKSNYFGRSLNIPLEFDITLVSEKYIDAFTRSYLEKLFLGRTGYLPLKIVQDDLSNVNFYVIFNKGISKYIGNMNVGISLHAKCNSPWGYTESKTLIKKDYSTQIISDIFSFFNSSDDSDYLYPQIIIKTTTGGTIQIQNLTEGTSMDFTGLLANETLTIDCYNQIIKSDTGLKRISNFNKKFFRLVQELNSIQLIGGILEFDMTYQFAKKVGG